MKTTVELPDELMRAVKIRAVNEGRRIKDVVADLISRGLAQPTPERVAALLDQADTRSRHGVGSTRATPPGGLCSAARPKGQWRHFALRDSSSPKPLMDAYLAAFATAGGHTMVTKHSGFQRFVGVDLILLG